MQVNVLRTLRLNPLRIVSAALLFLAPFLSWITVSAFGITVQSNLFDVAQSRTATQIPQSLPLASLIAIALLMIGGLVLLRKAILGLPIAAAGLGFFFIEAYGLYDAPVSVIPVVIAPGLGVLLALVAMGIGAVSLRVKSQDFTVLVNGLRTRDGLTGPGVFAATTALLLDGMNHAAQGELSAFFGTGVTEPLFHTGFLASTMLILSLFLVRKWYQSPFLSTILVVAAFSFIGLDAAYHLSSGDAADFLGHDLQETVLHALAYYGTALLVIGRLSPRTLKKPKPKASSD